MNGNQTIRRAPKDKGNPYKAIRRATFEDQDLSFEARGVLGYILVKPDDWQIHVSDLMRQGGIGRDKAYRILNELIAVGYCKRVEYRDDCGRISGYTYLIDEEPSFADECTQVPLPEKAEAAEALPLPEKPYTEKPLTVNTYHTKEEVLPLKKNFTKKEKSLVAVSPQPARPSSPIIEPPTEKPQENPESMPVCESPPTPPHCEAPPAPPKREKPAAHPGTRPILDAYTLAKERLEPGAVIHYAAEGVAARQLAEKGWTPESVVECFELMKRDGWWKEKSLRLASVASQIGAKLNGRRVDDYDPAKDKWYQGPYDGPAYDLDTVEITF